MTEVVRLWRGSSADALEEAGAAVAKLGNVRHGGG